MTDTVVVQGCAVLAGDGLAPAGRGKWCACERVGGSPMLYCRVHDLCECIHEIERSLNYRSYDPSAYGFSIGSTGIAIGHRARRRADALRPALSTAPSLLQGAFSAVTDKNSCTHRCPHSIFFGGHTLSRSPWASSLLKSSTASTISQDRHALAHAVAKLRERVAPLDALLNRHERALALPDARALHV